MIILSRNFATFDFEVDDRPVFSSAGDIIKPGGRGIMLLIRTMLEDELFIVGEILQHSFYGWELSANKKNLRVWILLQYPGPWLLIIENKTFSLIKLNKFRQNFDDLLGKINIKIADCGDFRNVLWFTKSEYENITSSKSGKL